MAAGDRREDEALDDHAAELAFARHESEWLIQIARRDGRRAAFEDTDYVPIPPTSDADYVLPQHLLKIVPATHLRELEAWLAELRQFVDGLTGTLGIEARVQYHDDCAVELLQEVIAAWLSAHLRRRLVRPAPRDRHPIRRLLRLYGEVGPWLAALAAHPGHAIVLRRMPVRFMWIVQEAVLGPCVDADPETGAPRFSAFTAGYREVAVYLYVKLGWQAVGEFGRYMRRFPLLSGPPADPAELTRLVNDLIEAKGLLVRGYRWVDAMFEVPADPSGAPGPWVVWTWTHDGTAGELHCADTADALRAALDTGSFPCSVSFGFDGRPRQWIHEWAVLPEDEWGWALALLRPVHERMLTRWIERYRAPVEPPTDERDGGDGDGDGDADGGGDGDGDGDGDEVVARACADLAERLDAPAHPPGRPWVPAVRTITLLALLERQFDCEVRNGKGSEITVWRLGGRKYTLGHHRKNLHVPAHVVRGLLKAVGIDPRAFARAVKR